MTDNQTPADWVLIEAAKRCGKENADGTIERLAFISNPAFLAKLGGDNG